MRSILLAFIAISIARSALGTAFIAPTSFELSRAERKALEEAACIKLHGVKLDRAVGYYSGGEKISAIVRCAAHSRIAKYPVHYQVKCWKEDGYWDCWNTTEYLRARVDRQELLLEAPRTILQNAYGATRYLLENGRFEPSPMSDPVSIRPRWLFYVHVERVDVDTVRIQDQSQWLYVKVISTTDGMVYQELDATPFGCSEAKSEEPINALQPTCEDAHG
jgi:hypothetical protein